jgi:peptidylprolyl isomerase
MAQVKKGDRVKIKFTGKLEDGTIFDSTSGDHHADEHQCGCDDCGCEETCEETPFEMVVGEEEFFVQVEEALIGMAPGDKKTINIASDDAFGDYDEECVFTIERSELPDDMQPEIGQEVEMTDEDDQSVVVTVVEVTDTTITFDANHPLAGEDLTFDIELVEIV